MEFLFVSASKQSPKSFSASKRRHGRVRGERPLLDLSGGDECEAMSLRQFPTLASNIGLIDQVAVSGGQSSGTSAGGLVHGSSTSASWNHCSRRFACSVTISW